MSSLIEWPSIYGNSYFVPAILVVALLLSLLLLLSSRRRRAMESARNAPDMFDDMETPALAAATAGAAEAAPPPVEGVITEPLPIAQPIGMARSTVVAQPVAAAQPVAMAEPLSVMQPMAVTQPPTVMQPVGAGQTLTATRPYAAAAPITAPAVQTYATVAAAGAGRASVTPPAPTPAEQADEAAPVPPLEPASASVPPLPDLNQVASGRKPRITVKVKGAGPISGVAGNDPLNMALVDILNGWGDLGPEDTKRLDLFRPDRVAAAVATLQVPKSKSNEVKGRLSQLRQYSAGLELRSVAMNAAAASAAAAAATHAVTPPPPPVAPLGPIALPELPTLPEPMAAPTAPIPVATVRAHEFADEAMVTTAALPSMQAAHTDVGSPAAGGAAAGLAAAIAVSMASRGSAEGAEQPATAVAAAGAASMAIPENDYDDLGSLWAQPRSLWDPAKSASEDVTSPGDDASFGGFASPGELAFEEAEAPTYHEVEVDPDFDPDAIPELIPAGDGGWNGQKDSAKPSVTSSDTYFWDDLPSDPVSRLSVKVETAEQLLALPPDERVDMTAFLGPSELTATFRATSDPQLKRAVIDTLEHVGTPASLNALGNCFEDPDSDIQVYALQAADRLLGVV